MINSNYWFQDPPPEPFSESPETIGVFKHGYRRPIANRFLIFTSSSAINEDKTTHCFMIAFPVHCNDPLMQAFSKANPLVNSVGASQKFLTLPTSVFKETQMPCTEVPLTVRKKASGMYLRFFYADWLRYMID